jgi:hypothetical protein
MPGEQIPAEISAGMAATELIANPKSWINRRVETIELLSRDETRRRVSIDYTLSEDQQKALEITDGVAVPIAVLTKQPRRQFDLRDEGGRAVAVLGKSQNGELAHVAILNAALNALPDLPSNDAFELLVADLGRIVFSAADDAADALAYFIGAANSGDPLRQTIWADEICQTLLSTLWENYVLFAVLPPDGPNRRILKYAYGDDAPLTPEGGFRGRLRPSEFIWRLRRPDRERFLIFTPGASRAVSFHVEVAIPEELRIGTAFLYDFEEDDVASGVDEHVNRASLYAAETVDPGSDVNAYVEVAPERGGMTSQAAITSTVVAALLWLGVNSGLDAKNPGAAVSLLLAGAALFSGLTARGERLIVRMVFSAARFWLSIVTVSSLAASATLAMELPDAHPVAVWRGAAIACSVAAVRMAWSAIRAPK